MLSQEKNDRSPSLNDVIEVGPPLQNQMWKVLIRNRMCPVTLTGDMKQAFLQIRIREKDRNLLRFHCSQKTSTYTNLQGQYSVLGKYHFY